MKAGLDKIFEPKSIAVIGATDKEGSVGVALVNNLINDGFEGGLYMVNPRREELMGRPCYPSIKEVPETVDLAIIVTPAKTIPGIMKELGKAGVGGVLIISAGFGEAGEEGEQMSQQIYRTAKKYKMRVVGPNCLGFLKPSLKLNASFANKSALPGRIAFISQSGALCTAILDWAQHTHTGFSSFVSIGSMLDVGFHDLIDYFGQDPSTTSIVIYMESLTNARAFLSAARAFARNKPIIVLKSGRSSEGAEAAKSHTGSLAGNDEVFNAAYKRAGIIRVNTIEELFKCADALAKQKRPRGNRLAIITNAGGPGVLATDYLSELNGKLAQLQPETITKLNEALPAHWSKGNPVDVLGDASPELYQAAIDACVKDKNVDGVLVLLSPQAMTAPTEVARKLLEVPNKSKKTILASWMGASQVEEATQLLSEGNIPVFESPEDAVKVFMYMHQYSANLELLYETPSTIPHAFMPDRDKTRKIIDSVIEEGRLILTEKETKDLLTAYQIPSPPNGTATTVKEAVEVAKEIGYPVVMKILSTTVMHKTDLGGVKLNLQNDTDVKNAFEDIMESVKQDKEAKIDGVFIEKMAKKKYELIIGSKKDPIFGPTILFGQGGTAVEILKDTSIGLPPLNMALAMRIMEDTTIIKLLRGYRGIPGVDLNQIQFLLYKFSYLLMDYPEIKELDINPFMVDEEGGFVVDGKLVLDEDVIGTYYRPRQHMVISPYPQELETDVHLKNGLKVHLRPIKPEDEPLEAELFSTFSEQTMRFRFFGIIKDITHERMIRYTQIDYGREIAIVAVIKEGNKDRFIGVTRLVADADNDSAEFAVVVGDPWHRQGLGNIFLDYIIDIAHQRRIHKIYADVLKQNHGMLHMFSKRGFFVTEEYDDSKRLELEL